MPWEKGKSGNPKGSPKRPDSLAGISRAMFEEPYGKSKKKKKDAFIHKVYSKAMAGDTVCMRMLWEYYDGKPKQQLEISTSKLDELMESFGSL